MAITLTKITEFNGHRQSIYALASYDENRFFSAGGDGLLVLWEKNQADGSLLASLPGPVFSLAADPETGAILAGTQAGKVYEFDFLKRVPGREWPAHQGAVFSALYTGEGLLTAGEDGYLRLWDQEAALLNEWKLSAKSLRTLCAGIDGSIWIGGSEGAVWNMDTAGNIRERIAVSETSVFALAHRGKQLYTAGRDARLRQWAAAHLQLERPAHLYSIHALALNPSGNLIASGSMDKTIKLWSAPDLELLKVIDFARYQSHTSSVNSILWLNDRQFVSCGDDRKICLFGMDG